MTRDRRAVAFWAAAVLGYAVLGAFFQPRVASAAGPALASVMIYLIMAVVLYFRPQGLFPARG